MRTNTARCLGSTALALLLAASAANAQIVINLNEMTIPVTQCNELWTDNDVDLHFVPSTDDDACPGACLFEPFLTAVSLFGRLQAELGEVGGIITSVEVDIEPFCAPGCARAYLYEDGTLIDSDSNPTSPNFQTLVVNAGPNLVDQFMVSGCEMFVYEIRIHLQQANGVETITQPASFEVGPAAPNPFRNDTTISFRIVESAPVRVSIYDVRGTRIRTLLERPLAHGAHAASWDGRTDAGVRVPAGVYFYEVRAGAEIGRQKVVRLR